MFLYRCSELLNIFSFVQDDKASKAGTSYSVTVGLAWMSALTWLCTVIVMCLRCFVAADFDLTVVGTDGLNHSAVRTAEDDLSSLNESTDDTDDYLLKNKAKSVVTFESNL